VLDVRGYTDEVHPEAVYQALLDRGVFALERCEACGRAHYSPRVLCPYCGSDRLGWVESTGLGTVYSTTAIAPRGKEPYAVALIDLDDGVRMMTNVVGIPAADVAIGSRVRVLIEPRESGAVPVFTELGA
jgi:uncharacterized OB-fold protein